MFRIHDILVWFRPGSMPLTNGSGSGSCYLRHWPSRCQQKANFFKTVFCLLLFEVTYTSFFKDKKFERSLKTAGRKVFLTIFACWSKDPDPDPYLWLMDPYPGGPKTCGSGGSRSGFASGSGTLVFLKRTCLKVDGNFPCILKLERNHYYVLFFSNEHVWKWMVNFHVQ